MFLVLIVDFILISLISTSPLPVQSDTAFEERPEDREECWCGLFRAFIFEDMFVIERTVGERCDNEGDEACSERCAFLSTTVHLQYTLVDKLCKLFTNSQKIMMGIASKTCEDRFWIDVGLRNEMTCFNGSFTDSTVPMNMMEAYHVQTDIPQQPY